MKVRIIFEDKDIIIVHKPAGIATESARFGQMDVVSELRNYLVRQAGPKAYLGMVHRLDQPVEGLLVFAKTQKAASELTRQLQSGRLRKVYQVLVSDTLALNTQGTLEDYLCKDGKTNLSRVVTKDTPGAKKAKLSWRLEEQLTKEENRYARLQVEIFTGRHHQIRVQFAHAGMPLLGDLKYGSEETLELSKRLGLQTVALVASSLTLIHPDSKKEMHFTIPHPEHW